MDRGGDVFEATAKRGLGGDGIPAGLLLAASAALAEGGAQVSVRSVESEPWRPLSDREGFFGWLSSARPSSLRIRVAGTDAEAACAEVVSLIDRGDPACLRRAGFEELPCQWPDPLTIEGLARSSKWTEAQGKEVFCRFEWTREGKRIVVWRTGHDLGLSDRSSSHGAVLMPPESACRVYCANLDVWGRIRPALEALAGQPDEGEIRSEPIAGAMLHVRGDEAWARLEVKNRCGLHARTSCLLVKLAVRFYADVILSRPDHDEWVDARSIIGLQSLGLAMGERALVRARGPDAAEAVRAIAQLFADRFHEE
ncbi:MAG: HPr family phosphocarrier protein [Planctomycetes bacterium]|nr:HPr family phosphocarrier protein [Planctomycetota bacterium]